MKAEHNIPHLKHLDISKPPSIKILTHAHRHECTPLRVHSKNTFLTSLRMRISFFLYPSAGGVGSRLTCAHDSLYKTTKHSHKPPSQLQTRTSEMWILILHTQTVSPQARCTQPRHLMEGFLSKVKVQTAMSVGWFLTVLKQVLILLCCFLFSSYCQKLSSCSWSSSQADAFSLKLFIVANGCRIYHCQFGENSLSDSFGCSVDTHLCFINCWHPGQLAEGRLRRHCHKHC